MAMRLMPHRLWIQLKRVVAYGVQLVGGLTILLFCKWLAFQSDLMCETSS